MPAIKKTTTLTLALILASWTLFATPSRAEDAGNSAPQAPTSSAVSKHKKKNSKKLKKAKKKKIKSKREKKRAEPLDVFIPASAAHWKPLSVSREKRRKFAAIEFERNIENTVEKIKDKKSKKIRTKKILKGDVSSARVIARVYGSRESPEIIVSIFPDALKDLREHLELRFFISQKRLVKAQAAMVAEIGHEKLGGVKDSREMRAGKIDFSEDFPSSGKIFVAALNPKPGKNTINSARLEMASFGENPLLGLVNAQFFARGLTDEEK